MTLRSPLLISFASSEAIGALSVGTEAGCLLEGGGIPIDVPQSAQKDFPRGDAALHFGQLKN
jgi:hypothetical protein